MSQLKIYRPNEPEFAHCVNGEKESARSDRFSGEQSASNRLSTETCEEKQPAILPFPAPRRPMPRRHVIDVVTRAHLLHLNKRCPNCNHATVEPLELQDAMLNRNRLPIPGTATLVGFHCHHCNCEWPAETGHAAN